MDCGLWCVLSERRRHVERLWRRRLLVTADEKRARRRFLRLMRGFDAEDVEVLRRAVESAGKDAKQCAPGPPMDERPEEEPQEDSPSPSSSQSLQYGEEESMRSEERAERAELAERLRAARRQEEDSGLIPQIDRPMSMPYLCCKMWRWKDLQVDAALHRLEALPWCRFGRVTINNATVSCCNPYHYALWIRPEVVSNDEDFEDEGPAHAMGNGHLQVKPSTLTSDTGLGDSFPLGPPPSLPPGTPDNLIMDTVDSQPGTISGSPTLVHQNAIAWGRLERWEKRERVSESVPLTGQFAAVGLLAQSVHDAQNVQNDWDTRNEVSFALIRQPDPIGSTNPEDVWLYNSGTRALFISISCSPGGSSRPETLRRLSPGYCVRVFKGEPQSEETSEREIVHPSSPREHTHLPTHLIISVGKGWGPNYHRLFLNETPIRYEVTFAP